MDLSIEDEDVPPPFFQRRSTWILGMALLVALGICGWWLKADSAKNSVAKLIQAGQYDQAWAKLHSNQSWIGNCSRFELQANLARFDERNDTLVLKMADSLRACHVAPDSLFEFVSLGNLRISKHNPGLDSNAQWALQSNAFLAASECIKADSTNIACWGFGFDALKGMKDTYGQVNWATSALTRWPNDSAFKAMSEEAQRANLAVKMAAAPAPTKEEPVATKKAAKPAKKKHK